MDVLLAIPARWGSSRFPGKPLADIAGVPMLARVHDRADRALALARPGVRGAVVVATDDDRIRDFARARGFAVVMTPASCPTGSDRALAAAREIARDPAAAGLPGNFRPEAVVNLQGDNPGCPPEFVAAVVDELVRDPAAPVVTPCVRLSWSDVDALRESKKTTPFSGTYAVLRPPLPGPAPDRPGASSAPGASGASDIDAPLGRVLARADALYFSKREIPALRKENDLRAASPDRSPLHRHVGLYGYRLDALDDFALRAPGPLESLEGLEQLRFLEYGLGIRVLVLADGGLPPLTGVDDPADVARVEAWLARHGS